MDSSLINNLREKISRSVSDPSQSEEILGLIDSLVAELPHTPSELSGAAISRHLDPEHPDPNERHLGIAESLEQLEITHPKAAELFHRIALALSNLGI
jgi:hypothetical protein